MPIWQVTHHLLISQNRINGYRAALKDAGIPFDETLVKESAHHNDHDEIRRSVQYLMNLKERPDAIFANQDLLAIVAMKELKRKGFRIPEDVAVAGFSDWLMSSFVEPSLTSVSQPGFEMGKVATELFIKQVEHANQMPDIPFTPETKIFKTKLIIRDSSKRL